jgi:hypothetical protein
MPDIIIISGLLILVSVMLGFSYKMGAGMPP